MNLWKRLTTKSGLATSESCRVRNRVRLSLESLEHRLAPAVINWVNRNANDGFTAAERALVDRALDTWRDTIIDFDGDSNNAPRTFNVTIVGGSTSTVVLGSGTLGLADQFHETNGIPDSGRVQIANIFTDGTDINWWIDPEPRDFAEFPNMLNRFAGDQGPNNTFDMYSVVMQELSHVLGFTATYTGFANRLTTNSNQTRTFTGNGYTATIISGSTHLSSTAHPSDLMNASFGKGTRMLVSDLDARMLSDAFGYRVKLPSTRETFLASLNRANGELTVRGELGSSNDAISLERYDVSTPIVINGKQGEILSPHLKVKVNNIFSDFEVSTLKSISVVAGAGADTVTLVTEMPVLTAVNGETDNDVLVAPNLENTWMLIGANSGIVANSGSVVSFGSMNSLVGGSNRDTFRFNGGGSVSGSIDGQAGTDLLDYSPRTNGVTVDLRVGTASFTGGITRIEDINGSRGDDLLRGDELANTITGGGGNDIFVGLGGADVLSAANSNGRSLLIGGRGSDTITGGNGDDVVIGQLTDFDLDNNSLLAIRQTWLRNDLNYAARIRALRLGVGANSAVRLTTTTVRDDGVSDRLTGGGGLDWFWTTPADTVIDPQNGEQAN